MASGSSRCEENIDKLLAIIVVGLWSVAITQCFPITSRMKAQIASFLLFLDTGNGKPTQAALNSDTHCLADG